MKTRTAVIHTGESFTVPQGIQRIDTRSTHGWQVRYQGTKMFSDGQYAGPAGALAAATKELLKRIAEMPAPVVLQRTASEGKKSGLPAGISGPIVRRRAGSGTLSASLSVLVPRYGQKSLMRSVYIASESKYTQKRFKAALKRAIEIRREAEERYALDATRARRRSAREFKAAAKAAAAPR